MRNLNIFRRITSIALIISLALLLSQCGGGGSSSAGIAGPAVSQGVVTALGSIFVNGVEYDTSNAAITIDDTPGASNELKVGMIAKVEGSSNNSTKRGSASTVTVRDILEGSIDAVGANTISVMGQTVKIEDNVTRLNDDDTIKTFAAAGFAVGDFVEVHGYADENGDLIATRVVKKASGEFEVKGFVTGLGASSFGLSRIVNGTPFVTVNFTAGQLPAGIADGIMVEVKSTAAPSGGVITASLIRLEDKRLGSSGEEAEVEGIVTSGTLADFIINGQQVLTDSATVFRGGLSTDFAIGVKLEAEGPLDSDGAILASKISFHSSIQIEGDASAVTPAGLTVLGQTIITNQFTRGDTALLANGDHVRVRAKADRNGNLIATRIKIQSPSPRASLQGPISAADSSLGTLTILGTTLASDNSTEWRLNTKPGDMPVSQADFFAQLIVDASVVKVRWDTFTTLTAPISEAEIEDGD